MCIHQMHINAIVWQLGVGYTCRRILLDICQRLDEVSVCLNSPFLYWIMKVYLFLYTTMVLIEV